MSNVMNMANLKNHVSRNGFDLSERTAFTAKVGQLLPVFVRETLPGDKFKINLKAFARTQPVNTAAFTRIRQYYDFFFVPYSQIWRNFKTFITQMSPNNQTKASSITQAVGVSSVLPYFTTADLANVVRSGSQLNSDSAAVTDILGFNAGQQACKLFDYLGYGDYSSYLNIDTNEIQDLLSDSDLDNVALNPFPLLAYQKIYFDFFRNQQWEKNKPWCYNLDYVDDSGTISAVHLPVSDLYSVGPSNALNTDCMFTMRYCNWNKDLFMGLLPRQQYSTSPASVQTKQGIVSGTQQFDILSLRQAQALQKWSEISLSGNTDYKTQIEKHFGISLPQCLSDTVKYIGGTSDSLDISEVVNQNLIGDNASTISGKGVGVTDGYINFDTDEYGVIMCIYHAVPLLDYSTSGIYKHNLRSAATDFAIPEFDKLGLQPVNLLEFMYDSSKKVSNFSRNIGYAPRYYDYKTSYDRILGSFKTTEYHWCSPVSREFAKVILTGDSLGFDYTTFKVNPHIVDSIFGVNSDSSVDTDQLLINCAVDCRSVRNLDYDGMPNY